MLFERGKKLEKIAHRLAEKIALSLEYDAEKQAVIAYGLTGLLQLLALAVIFTLLGILFSLFWELAILYIAVALYRKYSGGGHASSMEACMLFSVLICLLLAFAAKGFAQIFSGVPALFIAIAGTFVFAGVITWRRAPVDSPNKPIRTEKKKHRMRRGAFVFLAAAFCASLFLFWGASRYPLCGSCGFSLLLAVCWQAITLTPPGIASIRLADRLLLRLFPDRTQTDRSS